MNFLSSIKSKLDEYYVKHPLLTGYIIRLVLSIIVLFLLRANIGFNEILTNTIFVIVFALVCCFIPTKLMTLALIAYAIVQLFSLSVGIGVVSLLLFMIMYLVYFRFDEKTGYAIVLIPLLCMLRFPFLIPVVLAVSTSLGSVVSIILGFFAYYYLHYIQINTAVFLGATETGEVSKMSMVLQGLFSYREMWYVLAVVLLAFVVTYYLKKININRSSQMAVSIGSGIYLILILMCNLIFDTMNYNKLIWYVASTVVTIIVGIIIADIVLPLDYSRTVLLEFEDEEYKYYVRAVPKARVTKESVKIKRIYSRKRTDSSKNPDAGASSANAGAGERREPETGRSQEPVQSQFSSSVLEEADDPMNDVSGS